MAEIRGCLLPQELYYLVEKHVWAKVISPEQVRVGLTSVAQKLSGKLTSITPKETGKVIAKGKSIGTAESAKWVGPVPAPVSGTVARTNPGLADNPTLVNSDPYGEGWIVELTPANLDEDLKALVTGPEGIQQYQAFLEKEGISCS